MSEEKYKCVLVPRQLLEDVVEDLYELRGAKEWWKDEPRYNYSERYAALCNEIVEIEKILESE